MRIRVVVALPSCARYHPGGFCARSLLSVYVREGRQAGAGGPAEQMHAVLHLAAHGLWARWRGGRYSRFWWPLRGAPSLPPSGGGAADRQRISAFPPSVERVRRVQSRPPVTGLGGYPRALARLPGVTAVEPSRPSEHAGTGAGSGTGRPPVPACTRHAQGAGLPTAVARSRGVRSPSTRTGPARHLRVGSIVVIRALRSDRPPSPADERTLRERVVGVVVTRSSVKPISALDKIPMIFASTALVRHLGPTYQVADGALIKLRPGTTVDGFRRHAAALARQFPGTQAQDEAARSGPEHAGGGRRARHPSRGGLTRAFRIGARGFRALGGASGRPPAGRRLGRPPVAGGLGVTRGQLMAAGRPR